MSTEQLKIYLTALASSFTIDVIIPLLALTVMMGIAARLLVLAQRKPDFDIARMLKDDNDKPSMAAFISILAFSIHTWYLMVSLVQKGPNPEIFQTYGLIWSGATVLAKWDGKLPGTRG